MALEDKDWLGLEKQRQCKQEEIYIITNSNFNLLGQVNMGFKVLKTKKK